MDSSDKGVDIRKYITILKRTTVFVQFFPFVYSSIYILVLVAYPFVSDPFATALDSAFYVSPAFMAGMLFLSKILRLCVWHRIACLVPITSQVPVVVDRFIVSMTQVEAIVSNSIIIVMAVMLVIAAYNVFFR